MKIRVCLALLVMVASAAAQLDGIGTLRRLRVHVTFTNGVCDVDTHVALVGNNSRVAEGVTNDQCNVDFLSVPEGTYHVDVSGQGVEADAGTIHASMGNDEFEVKVDHAGQGRSGSVVPSPFVSVTGLNVPPRARKDFDKANELIRKQDFAKAIESLNRAVETYPTYAEAYNNLGVTYARMGDHAHEQEALEKAIHADDHFAPAYVNLGRMSLQTGDPAGAEASLNKAASLDPTNAMTFVLLSYSQFMNHHFDLAIASAKHAHTLNSGHAYAHQVAARAFEQKRDAAGAIAELELFLKEESTGARADSARKELTSLQAYQALHPHGAAAQ